MAVEGRLASQATAFTPDWLIGQRWFRAKQRLVTAVELRDAVRLDRDPGWLLVLGARYADGDEDHYLVPAVLDGPDFREPRDGEGAWAGLAAGVVAGGELRGSAGGFGFEPTPAIGDLAPEGAAGIARLAERRIGAEQSNTSVVIGERLILKIYRLLEPGTNPEVEMSAFLSAVGFAHAPALAGAASYLPADGDPRAAAMLQAFVPSAVDAWSWLLARLAEPPGGPAEAVTAASEIGAVTAAMHAALASRPDAPGFPARLADPVELAAWRTSAERQLQLALEATSGEVRLRIEAVAPAVVDRLAAIEAAGTCRVSRIHGDLHLGQLLRTGHGFVVIDFEGEPARPLPERRAPSSPLRDVAGLLRSLDYAAHTVVRSGAAPSFEADAWLLDARAALLVGYGGVDPREQARLAAFELEKACYEIRYEASHRPGWAWLPLGALERMAAPEHDPE